jgi:zinc transport system ATP-binding protein
VRERIVSFRDVSVAYSGTEALQGVNLDIYSDDFVGVIGPNGGGKTTLVRAILGMIPHTGTITYSPILTSDRVRKIGYLPQQNSFDSSFPISVEEVVVSGLQSEKGVAERYHRSDFSKARELLDMTGISALARRTVGEISGGELQRTLLCRALISNPRLLILDEPTNFVDNSFESELYALLRTLSERIAIVMVSHDVGAIADVVRSIVCVNRSVHRQDSES